jgi:3-phenylpropionate/cinnamic acid dioxygenase small subunit
MATEASAAPSGAIGLWFEAVTWLDREAELLDESMYEDWLALLTEDIQYSVPLRLTRERGAASEVRSGAPHFLEDMTTLRMRVERLKTEFAWAEDPPSRTRRFVTNVRPRHAPAGIAVRSYLLLYRSRGEDTSPEMISAERDDLLRRTDGGLRLCERIVTLDQATLGVRNLAVLL